MRHRALDVLDLREEVALGEDDLLVRILHRGVVFAFSFGDELGQWVKEALADYKRPRRWLFVDALPRTPTGKVLKRELKQRLAPPTQARA